MSSVDVPAAPLHDGDLPWLDLESKEWMQDPIGVSAGLHAQGWLARSSRGIEVLSHSACREFLQDERMSNPHLDLFRGAGAGEWLLEFVENGLLPTMEGEKHARIRRVLSKAFLRRRIDEQRDVMREVANRLVDRLIEAGEFDFVEQFARWYPIEVVCRLLGVPVEDIPQFADWVLTIGHFVDHPLGSGFSQAEVAIQEMATYVDDLVEVRRRKPQDDFISTLIEVQDSEGRLSREELQHNLVNLLFAGQDTTQYQLSWALKMFADYPGEWKRLVLERGLEANAADEVLRIHPVVRLVPRTPAEEFWHRGFLFKPGDVINLNFYAANHDPDVFPNPSGFDISRPNANRHLTFSFGAHVCLGAALARAEMVEAFDVLADRMPDFELSGAATLSSPSDRLGGVLRLPMHIKDPVER